MIFRPQGASRQRQRPAPAPLSAPKRAARSDFQKFRDKLPAKVPDKPRVARCQPEAPSIPAPEARYKKPAFAAAEGNGSRISSRRRVRTLMVPSHALQIVASRRGYGDLSLKSPVVVWISMISRATKGPVKPASGSKYASRGNGRCPPCSAWKRSRPRLGRAVQTMRMNSVFFTKIQ